MNSSRQGHRYEGRFGVSEKAEAHFGDVYNLYNDASESKNDRTRCLQALFLADPAIDHRNHVDTFGKRAEGTCEWVIADETYNAWKRENSGFLWIRGGPGQGKTTLAIFLTETLELEYADNVMYFFCNSEDESHRTSTSILRSLSWQIVSKQPELATLILPWFDIPQRVEAVLSSAATLWDIFLELLKRSCWESMYYLLDGLDVCDDSSTRWLIAHLLGLQQDSRSKDVHIVVVSRDLPDLRHVQRQTSMDSTHHDKVGSDVEVFAAAKMKELAQRLELTENFTSLIRAELLGKAEATFLWIGYAVSELLTKKTGFQIQQAVRELPTALTLVYSQMLSRNETHNIGPVSSILRWVALAFRPLSLMELADALSWQVPNGMGLERAAQDCVGLCQSLITVQQERVILVHQSAKDYLLRTDKGDNPLLEIFRIKAAEAHLQLAQTCLDRVSTSTALTIYACRHWPGHAKQCDYMLLIAKNNDFFRKGSKLRKEWWRGEVRRVLEQSPSHYLAKLQDMSRLEMAYFFGLRAWPEALKKIAWRSGKEWREKFVDDPFQRVPSLDIAVLGGHLDMVEYIAGKCGPGNYGTFANSSLLAAVDRNEQLMVECLLSHGGNVNATLYRSIDRTQTTFGQLGYRAWCKAEHDKNGDKPDFSWFCDGQLGSVFWVYTGLVLDATDCKVLTQSRS